jgi:Carboxypeptidase regulatory-like domain
VSVSRVASLLILTFLPVAYDGNLARLIAQGATATILGTVTDTSGAAIPEAAVQVKNVQTDVTQSAATDAQGRFRISIWL